MKKYKFKTIVFIVLVSLFSCNNDDGAIIPVEETQEGEIPVVRTLEVTDITTSSTLVKGNVSYSGSSAVINHGVCWSTSNEPTILNDHTEQGSLSGNFTTPISSLNGGTDYYVRSYATNSEGTGYGEILNFRTLGAPPEAITVTVEDNFPPNITLIGYAKANLLTSQVYFQYSLTNDFQDYFTSEVTQITQDMGLHIPITNLTPNTTYYYRIVVENSAGISYGETLSFISQFTIGDYYKEAYILYVDETGLHGLLCKEHYTWYDWVAWIWGHPGLTGGNETALYTGAFNSQKMLDLMDPSEYNDYVVGRISNFELNGYNDWYMPSKDELNLVYLNLYVIYGGATRWSSSEVDINSVWVQDFATGEQYIKPKESGGIPRTVGISEF